ncbi:putative hydrolase of the HAD superfamily [Kribbella steppae]|uniref:Putative hydrolase of the HAD superfamily n=1 Tax=Kribbella steppae TaxID=2512223 RepID=A0A4R2HKF1_9ACTN|nr:HAD family hydrolase [Kribbella steppae]TCO30142.1 putative hydrolase of the HAD superfamily [Kribbella steppae]
MKAVVFDLDNTLFDHTESAAAAVRSWLPELGGTASDALVAQWFVIEERNFNQWLNGVVTHQGQRRGRLRDFLPLLGHPVPELDEDLDQLYTGYLRHYEASWAAYPDARPALEVARSNGLEVGVLTNGSTTQQNAKLAAIGLADLVDVVCTSESLGVSKPDPQAYLQTCSALGVEPADTVMIGDNLELDVLAARKAGLTAHHLDRAAGITLLDLVRSRS